MNLHGTPASIAAALRRAADDLDAMGDVTLSPVTVQLDLQAVQFKGTGAERITTVDALCAGLLGVTGEMSDHSSQYGAPFDDRDRIDLSCAIYADPAERDGGPVTALADMAETPRTLPDGAYNPRLPYVHPADDPTLSPGMRATGQMIRESGRRLLAELDAEDGGGSQ